MASAIIASILSGIPIISTIGILAGLDKPILATLTATIIISSDKIFENSLILSVLLNIYIYIFLRY
jgi:hypothetical protein